MRTLLFLVFTGALLAAPCSMPDKTCMERIPAGENRHLSVYRSHALTEKALPVERAFIMVHGTKRDGDLYFKTAVTATEEAGQLAKTIVIAPQFRANDGERCNDALDGGELSFPCNGWKDGQPALNGSADSFAVMDRVLTMLDDKSRFPNLKEIVVAGHSAGGQYVQRYAAGNRIEEKLSVPVRYLVANPSSYLYLEPWRPAGNPPKGCPDYNKYKYGLVELSGYLKQTGAASIRKTYPRRDVTYLLGELDTQDSNDLDKSCPAMAQGENRMERGLAYWKRLNDTFSASHKLVKAPGCGHSADCMYRSEAGKKTVFAP